MKQSDLATRFREVRALTEEIAGPLSAEDQTVQSMPDVSPTKWHRAHTTWFFEAFLLSKRSNYKMFDPRFAYLFNSYYVQLGERYPRPERGFVTRPGVETIAEYRRHVDEAVVAVLERHGSNAEVATITELGLHHEQQHQELMLMDIKHVLSRTPFDNQYRNIGPPTPRQNATDSWVSFDGGLVEVGHDGTDFSFDNELPRHRVWLEPFELASRPVTCDEWIAFIEDGGYQRPELWLSEGWRCVCDNRWEAPLYWSRDSDGGRQVFTLGGTRAVSGSEPVCHISSYEAHAFATWADARLPTEFEWEHASSSLTVDGDFLDLRFLHPRAVVSSELSSMFGGVWEHTSSAYLPYPGYQVPAGAVGEYNGKFMSGQMILRGGCAFTPEQHIRPTYRNFFPPHSRWMLAGLRLCRNSSQ